MRDNRDLAPKITLGKSAMAIFENVRKRKRDQRDTPVSTKNKYYTHLYDPHPSTFFLCVPF